MTTESSSPTTSRPRPSLNTAPTPADTEEFIFESVDLSQNLN